MVALAKMWNISEAEGFEAAWILARKKQPLMNMRCIHLAYYPFQICFFCHAWGIHIQKKKRHRSHLGLIAIAIFTSATDAFTLRKHCSFISEYICVNSSKKKERGRTVGVWDTLAKHSMAIQHVYFLLMQTVK